MMLDPWGRLRKLRYALPRQVEKRVGGPGPADAVRASLSFSRKGIAATIGYFQSGEDQPDDILRANVAVAALLAGNGDQVYLSVKAPPLSFDRPRLRSIAQAASAAGTAVMFDAHAPKDADQTLDLVSELLPEYPGTGFAVPARWSRSAADAARFQDSSARIRVIKGEWADPSSSSPDIETQYLALVTALAGRAAPVGVATHDPALAERALTLLQDSGTPCELEQLRGLPRRRTMAIARRLGVPVRIYIPFGPGWWPYALDKALARPYLPWWMVRDLIGI